MYIFTLFNNYTMYNCTLYTHDNKFIYKMKQITYILHNKNYRIKFNTLYRTETQNPLC